MLLFGVTEFLSEMKKKTKKKKKKKKKKELYDNITLNKNLMKC